MGVSADLADPAGLLHALADHLHSPCANTAQILRIFCMFLADPLHCSCADPLHCSCADPLHCFCADLLHCSCEDLLQNIA